MFMFQYVTVLLRIYHFYKQVRVDCIWFNLTDVLENNFTLVQQMTVKSCQ